MTDQVEYSNKREWLLNPWTKRVLDEIERLVTGIKDMWVEGNFTGDTSDATIQLNAKALGMAQTANSILEIMKELPNGE